MDGWMDDNVHVDYERWGNAPFLHPPPERPRRTIRATSSALNFASFFRLNYISLRQFVLGARVS
jgi:hypothetical protein